MSISDALFKLGLIGVFVYIFHKISRLFNKRKKEEVAERKRYTYEEIKSMSEDFKRSIVNNNSQLKYQMTEKDKREYL